MEKILLILAVIVIAILLFLLHKKHVIETVEIVNFDNKLQQIKNDIERNEIVLDDLLNDIETAETRYKTLFNEELNNINKTIEDTKNHQEQQLEQYLKEKQTNIAAEISKLEQSYTEKENSLQTEYNENVATIIQMLDSYKSQLNESQQLYDSLLEPLKLYEKEKQEKIFYTIQIPEEYHDDINFLITDVTQRIRHPDIISKLIWSEYIKPYMDDTLKRVGIKDEPGIYKITNINSGKAYVGKSTNIKKRLQDHFKGAIGIRNIADQVIHHEILKEGIWNWAIECITYCDKDKLSELEKYYIEFFKTQEFGYNRKEGG